MTGIFLSLLSVLATLGLAMQAMYLAGRNRRLALELQRQRTVFSEFSSFIFTEAKMMDSKGKADEYDSKEVEEKWNKYHELCDEFYNGKRGGV